MAARPSTGDMSGAAHPGGLITRRPWRARGSIATAPAKVRNGPTAGTHEWQLRPQGWVGAPSLRVPAGRGRCGWAPLLGIVDAEVRSEALARCCSAAGLQVTMQRRRSDSLDYADGTEACAAAFAGGPVALAWSRFDATVRDRVQSRYLEAIAPWRDGAGYRVPAEYLIVAARRPLP
jgi:hypothetical protein